VANGSADNSIRGLIGSVTADAKKLASAQAELAKMELRGTSQEAGSAGGMFAGAAVLGGLGGLFLLVTLAYVLVALGLPVWAGFGIVTLVLFIVAAILGLIGRSRAKHVKGGLELTKLEWQRTQRALSGQPQENLPAVRGGSSVAKPGK
jgi:hypothetical protein